ncbi:PTS sugar transporter, partial [Listeria monocytogenes]|nr:PTS sugar transporter [Listeria monocytogenes]
ERMHLLAGFGLSLMLALVVTISFMVGSNTISKLLAMIPAFVQNGLSVATGLIPALGFAMLARLLINKQVAPYFFLGFALAAYLEIPVTGIAIFGAITAVVVVNLRNIRGQGQSIQMTSGEVLDDDEDF